MTGIEEERHDQHRCHPSVDGRQGVVHAGTGGRGSPLPPRPCSLRWRSGPRRRRSAPLRRLRSRTVPRPGPRPPKPEPVIPPAVRLAEGLLATIPSDSRLALRPLDPRETGLPKAVGGRLYESILNAVA